jgi:WD40 repeat protein
MARLCQGRSSPIARAPLLMLSFLLVISISTRAMAQSLYDSPVLTVDAGMHTASVFGAAADSAGRFLVTGSHDKTVRIWSLSDGKLLQTIRMPAGPGNVGKIYAVAMSPEGKVVAAGGDTGYPGHSPIYLFDQNTGKMKWRIADDMPDVTHHLVFSADGRYLAASSGGLRVFDRDQNWSEVFRDDASNGDGADFAVDGRLAISSFDGKIRLYDRSFQLVATQETLNGGQPSQLAFRPDGKALAVRYRDKSWLDLLDGNSLARLPRPNVDGMDNGIPLAIAWSADGETLFASGRYADPTGDRPVFAWDQAGLGRRSAIKVKCAEGDDSTTALVSMPLGRLFCSKRQSLLYLDSS